MAVAARTKLELLRKLPLIYKGTHLADPAVHWTRGRVVELDAEPGSVRFEADGDPLGTLPARIEVEPAALSFLGPAA